MTFQLNVNENGIATLTFNLPNEKINKFSLPVLQELDNSLKSLPGNIKVLLIRSGKPDVFIAGADLQMFLKVLDDTPKAEEIIDLGHKVFNQLSKLPFPTIAVIDGACLGGGLEMALGCTYRVATDNPKTSIGLPETTLGIIPGWGGTQRLPRLIGLEKGVEMIVTGKPVNALKAWKLHLIDKVLPFQFQEESLKEFVKDILNPSTVKKILERRKKNTIRSLLLEKNPLGKKLLFHQVKKQIQEKGKGHYPAPVLAANLIEKTYGLPLEEGFAQEKQAFLQNPASFANAKHLISLFFANEALKKGVWEGLDGIKPKTINRVGLLGVGTMGAVIAFLISSKGMFVRFKELTLDLVGKGYAEMYKLYQKSVQSKKMKPWEAQLGKDRLSGTTDYTGFAQTDLIIEAVVENIEIKHQVLKDLENLIPHDVIIGSNTSSLTVSAMSQNMLHPERFLGMHFFNPPNKMPLVEIVPGAKTSKETTATALEFCKKLGKTAIIVADCAGFLVNRVFAVAANEVLWLLQDGCRMDKIEKVLLDFGMPMSPFLLSDEVGNDVTYKVVHSFEKAYGSRMKPPEIVELMYQKKLFGKKVGKGFYVYHGNEKSVNPEIQQLLHQIKTEKHEISEQDILDRVIFSMVNESARCLDEKVVKRVSDLDMALILGIGFPPFRGGLLRYADERRIPEVIKRLQQFEKEYGTRFEVSPYLMEMENQHKTFYD